VERPWEGAGQGLDVPVLYPVLSEYPTEVRRAPLARRRPGRPPWTETEFLEHLGEAQSKAAPSDRWDDIAAEFRSKDNVRGVDPRHLRRLQARFTKGTDIPE
jgi:hypothetical protein